MSGHLGAVNVWSPHPRQVADLLSSLVGAEPRHRVADDGDHFSVRTGELIISIHPGDRPDLELAFVVQDIDSALERCTTFGGHTSASPEPSSYGITARVNGPAPLRLELVQPNN